MVQRIFKGTVSGLACMALSACGSPTDDLSSASADNVLDEAVYLAALSEGDGDDLQDVPEGAPEEVATEALDDNLPATAAPDMQWNCSLGAVRSRVLASYDSDGNGQLSATERASLKEDLGYGKAPGQRVRIHRAMHPNRLRRLSWVYDIDGSGDLNAAERQELQNDLEARCQNRQARMLEKFDADTSGELETAELQAAREAVHQRIQARRQAVLQEHDTNGDGELNPGEMRSARATAQRQINQLRKAAVDRFDTDNDDALNTEEREALREFLRARVRGEHLADGDGI